MYQFDRQADGTYPALRTLYADGKVATLSRTSQYRTVYPFKREDGTEYLIKQDKWESDYDHRIYVPVEAVEEAGAESCRGAELHLHVEWEFKIYHIDHADLSDVYVKEDGRRYVALQLSRTETKYGNHILHVCDRDFFIAGTKGVLKRAGQYAYERETGRLYYYPEKPIGQMHFAIGTVSNLFSFRGFDAVTLYGLTFTGVEDQIYLKEGYFAAGQAGGWKVFDGGFPHAGAVKVYDCGALTVDACHFTELPCDGISLRGVVKNVAIKNCRFTHLGATAIRIGCSHIDHDPADYAEGVLIENNYIDDTGFTYRNCCAIIVIKGRDIRIKHNTILRSSYSAISVGWKWNSAWWTYRDGASLNLENVEIAYNFIKSFMTNMKDGGGIYTLGGNAHTDHRQLFNSIHDNVLIEDEYTCPVNGFFATIYHDGASSNWYDYNNIVVHNPDRDAFNARIYLQCLRKASFFTACHDQQCAWNILCENNYICCVENFGRIFASYEYDPARASDRLDYTRHLWERDTHIVKSVAALKKIPEAKNIWDGAGCAKR